MRLVSRGPEWNIGCSVCAVWLVSVCRVAVQCVPCGCSVCAVWQGTSQGLGATCPASPCWPPACHAQQCSSMPVLQHARAPACQCSSMPVLQHASAPASQCSSMPVLQQCSSMPVLQHASAPAVLQHASAPACHAQQARVLPRDEWAMGGQSMPIGFAACVLAIKLAWPSTCKHVCPARRMPSKCLAWHTQACLSGLAHAIS